MANKSIFVGAQGSNMQVGNVAPVDQRPAEMRQAGQRPVRSSS